MAQVRLGGLAKAGIFGNKEEQRSDLFNDGVQLPTAVGKGSEVAFICDVSVTATVDFTSWLSLRGGYMLAWFDGLALAPDQFNLPALARQEADGPLSQGAGVLYHGAMGGLELRY
jgi:hypothetical protein